MPVQPNLGKPSGLPGWAGARVAVVTCASLLLSLTTTVAFAQSSVVSVEYSVLRDPINGATGPYPIPGAEVRYKITIDGPGAGDGEGYRSLQLTDNLSDDMAIADTVTNASGAPEAGCAQNDLARLEVISSDPARAGVFCLTTTTAGVAVAASASSTASPDGPHGENVSLNLTLIPGVLPATETAPEAGSVKGDLLPGEQVLVEFNAVLR